MGSEANGVLNLDAEQRLSKPVKAVNKSLLMEKISKACKNNLLSPVDLRVLVLRGKTYCVHKDLFVMASPVFDSLLRNNSTANGRIHLEIEPEVFVAIRRFLCSERLHPNTSFDLTLKILEASFQYRIDRLLSYTIAFVEKNIASGNALRVLQTARALEFTKLEELALQLICVNAEKLLKDDEFITLGCWNVCKILSSDTLQCGEVDVFNAAYRWAEDKSKHSSQSKQSLKYYFAQVASCIRFPLMTAFELATLKTKICNVLEQDELLNLFQFVCTSQQLKAQVPIKFNKQPRTYPSSSLDSIDISSRFVSKETQTDEPTEMKFSMPPSTIGSSNPRKRIISGTKGTVSSDIDTTPSKVVKRTGMEEDDDSDDDPMFTTVTQMNFDNKEAETFEDLIRRSFYNLKKFKEDKNKKCLTGLHFSNAVIQSNYRNAQLFRNCEDVSIDAQCKFFDKRCLPFFKFIRYFDPMRYIQINNDSKIDMSVENIWLLNQNIRLKFNGVTFLRVNHAKQNGDGGKKGDILVMNYIRDSKKVLNNSKFKENVELALSNCEFSTKQFRDRGKQIEKLTLYRVWGDYRLEEIMKDCPNLKQLICWKHVVQSNLPEWPNFSNYLQLNFSSTFAAKSNIQKLSLYEVELRFPVRCANIATSVTELVLDHCSSVEGDRTTAHISEVFDQVFPKLQKLVILEHPRASNVCKPGNLATPSLINCVLANIKTIEKLVIENMKWIESFREGEDEILSSFLERNTEIRGRPEMFTLEKSCDGNKWVGTDISDRARESVEVDGGYWSKRDELEYHWFNLDYFYDSYEAFEDYFKHSDDGFPKPILWT